MINVVIPIGGEASRFRKLGISTHKAMLQFNGRENILNLIDYWRYTQFDVEFYFILRAQDKELFETISDYCRFNEIKHNILLLNEKTDGPVDTISRIKIENKWPIIVCDSDILPGHRLGTDNIDTAARVFYFEDYSDEERFSFIKFIGFSVKEVVEKKRISNYALLGVYEFANYQVLKSAIDEVMKQKGEKFMSHLVDILMPDVSCRHVSSCYDLGTLESYLDVSQVDTLLFDFDGVLADTDNAMYCAYNEAFIQLSGVSIPREKWEKHYRNRHFSKFAKELVEDLEESFTLNQHDYDEWHKKKKDVYKNFYNKIALNSYLVEWIRKNKDKYTIKITTMMMKKNLDEILKYFKINDLFDEKITGDDVKEHKPDPEVYLKAIEGLDKNKCIIFEDSEIGLQSAYAAKIRSIKICLN